MEEIKEIIKITENGLHIVLEITAENDLRLLHFSALPFDPRDRPEERLRRQYRLIELQTSGENQAGHHGPKHTGTLPAGRLRYRGHRDYRNDTGRKFEIELADPLTGLEVECHWQFYDGLPVVRAWSVVRNGGTTPAGLEYITSFALTGLARPGEPDWDSRLRLLVAHNTWQGEGQWRAYSLPELGLTAAVRNTVKRLAFSNTGTWSSSQFLPAGALENRAAGAVLFWQIEHNGSWHWEIGDAARDLYLQLGGPAHNENHWWKQLEPGQSFTGVPVAVGSCRGDYAAAFRVLTGYRRRIRRPNPDNERRPVIFNDFMNCLNGDPTTAKLLPLVERAAAAGCEVFCVDAGWYADGLWWDTVGEWQPAPARFPGGLREVLDAIRARRMTPGLWLEIEVMGMNSPLAQRLPDEWFFRRHGRRVIDNGRFQLDFRHPPVREYAAGVVARLVEEYGAGYLKLDYNIQAGPGTEPGADSLGDGLLEHNRAYLAWLDDIIGQYPDLIIENCASGGLRMDYALLSRLNLQSTSDQTDYRKYAPIAAGCVAAVAPEQCGVWAYPLAEDGPEAVIFNMVNALLLRVQLSGQLADLSHESLELVHAGVAVYKDIRQDIGTGLPFWPLGLPSFEAGWTALGLDCGDKSYLAVWRLAGEAECRLALPQFQGRSLTIERLYPRVSPEAFSLVWNPAAGELAVTHPLPYSARLYRLQPGPFV